MGSSEVAEMGMASVIHHVEIQSAHAKTALAESDNPSNGMTLQNVRANNSGPSTRPIFFLIGRSIIYTAHVELLHEFTGFFEACKLKFQMLILVGENLQLD